MRDKIDKKKLFEIARQNAMSMLKNGTLPGSQNLAPADKERFLGQMRNRGKTIDELTDFCKKLSNGQTADTFNDLSSVSSGDSESEHPDHDKEGNSKAFNHPFVLKDRGPIVLNIRNSVPLPPRTVDQTKAITAQFPVSSGQQHRQSEAWVPVEPKKPAPPAPAPVVREQKPKRTQEQGGFALLNPPSGSPPAATPVDGATSFYSLPVVAPVPAPMASDPVPAADQRIFPVTTEIPVRFLL